MLDGERPGPPTAAAVGGWLSCILESTPRASNSRTSDNWRWRRRLTELHAWRRTTRTATRIRRWASTTSKWRTASCEWATCTVTLTRWSAPVARFSWRGSPSSFCWRTRPSSRRSIHTNSSSIRHWKQEAIAGQLSCGAANLFQLPITSGKHAYMHPFSRHAIHDRCSEPATFVVSFPSTLLFVVSRWRPCSFGVLNS